jgi:nucleotide-binding universal stress UspA family protein
VWSGRVRRLRNLAVGSVAAAVATHAYCPVVIVRGDEGVVPGPERPIVVGVDGSAASHAALDFAAARAHERSAPLVVVCAWNVLLQDAWVGVDSRVMIDRDDLLRTERTAAQRILDEAEQRVRTQYHDLAVTASLVEAAPAAALLSAGADAGLIVVGASLLLGSVSHAVVHASTRPVAIVGDRRSVPDSEAAAEEAIPTATEGAGPTER